MDPLSFAFGALSAIELCFRSGKALVDACHAYRTADKEVQDRKLKIENCWFRTRGQLEYLRRIQKELKPDVLTHQEELLDTLNREQEAAVRKIAKLRCGTGLEAIGRMKKLRFVRTKASLDKIIDSLESWQRRFDPTWTTTLGLAKTSVADFLVSDDSDAAPLQRAEVIQSAFHRGSVEPNQIFCDPMGGGVKMSIPFSTSYFLQYPQSSYIIDPVQHARGTGADNDTAKKDVRALARKLRVVDSSDFAMLQCMAVARTRLERNESKYEFLFHAPQDSTGVPTSLRALLIKGQRHSLGERLRVAQRLARAVCYVHALQFVHKNIRPETILSFEQEGTPLGLVFLIGFETFRHVDGQTLMHGDVSWNRSLYQHPNRQNARPQDRHQMQHDIYSLGVCLLEIGLWTTFVSHAGEPTDIFGAMTSDEGLRQLGAKAFTPKLVRIAEDQLPFTMGDKYRAVVVNCLTCTDPDNQDFACTDEFEDEDEISIGVRYIEKILSKLEDIMI